MKTQNFLVSLDIAVRVHVEPDGKLVIETDYLGDVEVRKGPILSGPEESLRITGGCRLPSDESLRNHTIN
ncbi:TPA: hypothetical protein N3N81_006122, partial [Klebsiella variicola subsp. variicola]|nr:hypothetical protein [Klebsiella variicola subsp. variicola]HCM5371671.1 hypothetical protein [Klebsiella variicola subsp. variicola]